MRTIRRCLWGRFNASGPGRRLTEAQQEEEEAEQGMIRSDLAPEINEIAEAVHQHNQRYTTSDGVVERRVCVRKSRRI
jgi:hypothetical protein